MKKLIAIIGCLSLLSGCSIYEAVHAPSPVDYTLVQVGITRAKVISTLGIPKLTDSKNNQRVDTFEFSDGLNPLSKGRIILYLAGDIFTIGLAELIFWPLEANAFDGKLCRGTVSYNGSDLVSNYDILDSKGVPIWNPTIALTPKINDN